MAPRTIFLTGANRGIGLGLVKEILKIPKVEFLIAGARNLEAAKELQDLAKSDNRLKLLTVDVASDESLKNAVVEVGKIVGPKGLTLLINNAGVFINYGSHTPPNRQLVLDSVNVNAVGSLLLSQYCLPLLQQAAALSTGDELSADRAAIVNIASDCGSQELNDYGSGPGQDHLGYKMSKVAMVSFGRTLAIDYKYLNIPVLVTSIHPGWVMTEMGGEGAQITIKESASDIVAGLSKLNGSHAGGLFDRHTDKMPF